MLPQQLPVSVIFQRTPLANRWVDERWEPVAIEVEPALSDATPIKISDDASGTRWRFGGLTVELHTSEAEGFHLNVTSGNPKAFVMWRTADPGVEPAAFPVVVTVSYNQAARMLDGGERVDAVPLPPVLLALTEAFVAIHYKGEARRKVRRNDPFLDDTRGDTGTRH